MPIVRRRKTKQGLKQHMHMRRMKQIMATGHKAYALRGVIHCHSQVVACTDVAPREHHITQQFRPYRDLALMTIRPRAAFIKFGPRLKCCKRPRDIYSHREGSAVFNPLAPRFHSKMTAGSGIKRPFGAMRRIADARDFFLYLLPCAKAGIKHAQTIKRSQCRLIRIKMIRLPINGFGPFKTKPAQILINCGFKFSPAAGAVDIVDPQQKNTP